MEDDQLQRQQRQSPTPDSDQRWVPPLPCLPLPLPLAQHSLLLNHVPLPEALLPTTPSPPSLRTLANITGKSERQLWLDTIAAMEREPDAALHDLRYIRDWILHGVSLDFDSLPDPVEYSNTPAVLHNADVVRSRLQQYIDFQAVVELPPDHPCPFGVQPLHVIIKAGKKPRLVIDLSRNLNHHLQYIYFSYSTVCEAAEQSTPNCWYGKLDLSNCFLSFPLHPDALPHFIFRFEGKLYQFTRMPFGLSTAPRICTLLLSVVAYRLSREQFFRLIRYLDDFLFIARSQAEMERCLHSHSRCSPILAWSSIRRRRKAHLSGCLSSAFSSTLSTRLCPAHPSV